MAPHQGGNVDTPPGDSRMDGASPGHAPVGDSSMDSTRGAGESPGTEPRRRAQRNDGMQSPTQHRDGVQRSDDRRQQSNGRTQRGETNRRGPAEPRSGAIDDPNAGPKASVEQRRPAAVELQGEQRIRVRDAFMHIDRRNRAANIEVDISVGVVLPPRVVLRRLPPAIVRIVPAYRDYEYVEYADEILIVDPRTREIVYVIELSA